MLVLEVIQIAVVSAGWAAASGIAGVALMKIL
jgi:hypothetical protein